MNYLEVNEQLKTLISDLVDLGYKKTVVGKILLGSSGYAPVIKFLDNDNDDGSDLNLGIKPLTKVGNSIDYELRLVFVKNDNHEVINSIQEYNNDFFDTLRNAIISYMNSDKCNTRKPYTVKVKRKNEFESVLDEILSTNVLIDEDAPKLE